MAEAFILDALRSPRGKASPEGGLARISPVALVAELLHALTRRTGLDPAEVGDLILGCVTQVGPQGANLARTAALYAGWPPQVSGATLNRFCASGLEAVAVAAAKVKAGDESLLVAGGVEVGSSVPMFSDEGAWFTDPEIRGRTRFVHLGLSADLLASLESISRAELDAYAVESHRRAARARDEHRASRSLIPVGGLARDECIREGSTMEKLSRLAPAFAEPGSQGGDRLLLEGRPGLERVEHVHTVATSAQLADGAALVLIGDAASAARLGLRPRARILACAGAAVDPVLMLTGGVSATEKALRAARRPPADVDLFEVNEGFAAIPIHYTRRFRLDPARLNPNGGAIALGHALGATGAVLVGSLLDELERRDLSHGVVAICGGAGVASAVVIERV